MPKIMEMAPIYGKIDLLMPRSAIIFVCSGWEGWKASQPCLKLRNAEMMRRTMVTAFMFLGFCGAVHRGSAHARGLR